LSNNNESVIIPKSKKFHELNIASLSLQESKHARETKTSAQSPGASPAAAPSRMLWLVFQLTFRVYNFAGGQDERADKLTATIAHEIEAHPL